MNWIMEQKKDVSRKSGEIQKNSVVYLIEYYTNASFLVLIHVLSKVIQDVNIRESWVKGIQELLLQIFY